MKHTANDFDINVSEIDLVMESSMPQKRWDLFQFEGRDQPCLVYVIDGCAEYHFGDRICKASQGDIVFLNQKDPYYFEVQSGTYHYIYINFKTPEEDLKQFKNNVYTLKDQQVLRNSFEKLNTIWLYKKYPYKLECKSILYHTLYRILRSDSSEHILSDKYSKIKDAVEYMTRHYMDKDITISNVAGILDLCEVHFRRLFKEVYSISPIKYLNVLRIERAKDLLKVKGMPISDIADKVGYSSVFYFSKIFKKETGDTPTQYRRQFYEIKC